MTVSEARDWLAQFGRNVGGDMGANATEKDRALQALFDDFNIKTNSIREWDEMTLEAGNTDFDTSVQSGLEDFRAPLIIEAWIDDQKPLTISSHTAVREARRRCNTPKRAPKSIGFITDTEFTADSEVDQDYQLNLAWRGTVTSWDIGTADVGQLAYDINLPDEALRQIIRLGGFAFLQLTDPEHVKTALAQSGYDQFVNTYRGKGTGTGDEVTNMVPYGVEW